MKTYDAPSHDPKRVAEPRRPEPERQADAVRRDRTRFVDPYDMRSEPQPEEPGYGHGV